MKKKTNKLTCILEITDFDANSLGTLERQTDFLSTIIRCKTLAISKYNLRTGTDGPNRRSKRR